MRHPSLNKQESGRTGAGDGVIIHGGGHIGGGIHIIITIPQGGHIMRVALGKEYILIIERPLYVEVHQVRVTL